MPKLQLPAGADKLSLPVALNRAVACQQQGRLLEAEGLCRDILKAAPQDFDAQRLLGLLCHQQGRSGEAVKLIAAALKLRPGAPSALSDYGLVLQDLGRHAEALASYDQALTVKPADARLLNSRGTALTALGRHAEALASYAAAVAIKPTYAEAHYHRGLALTALDRHAEALASYDAALAIVPDAVEILCNRAAVLRRLDRHAEALAAYDKVLAARPKHAESHYGRGLVLSLLGRNEEALASYDQAIALRPDHAQALYNRGVALDALGRHCEALASYDRTLALRPDHVVALNNRGLALEELDRHEEALASYDKALAVKPNDVELLNNRGTVLIEIERFEEALASYDKALALQPDHVECRWNRALLLLRLGACARGWQDFEVRRRKPNWPSRNLTRPEWSGEAAAGKRLLFYSEYGLGDTIQFARFARAVAAAGSDVVLEVQPRLAKLLASLDGITVIRAGDELPEFDFHLPLLSLPHLLGTTLTTIPAGVPYLEADPGRVERMAGRLPPDGFNAGIVWQGNPHPKVDKGRSIPLRAFARLCQVPRVNLISLQKHDGVEQLHDVPAGMTVRTFGDDFDAGPDGFLDAAAAIMSLDLVITSDTAMAHLAGALGRPVWIVLKRVPDWRFLLEGDETPWYPTARLFRQSRRDDWDEVFTRVQSELARVVGRENSAARPSPSDRK